MCKMWYVARRGLGGCGSQVKRPKTPISLKRDLLSLKRDLLFLKKRPAISQKKLQASQNKPTISLE